MVRILQTIKQLSYLCQAKAKNGCVAEGLRHRSAKPATAVRIRPQPQEKELN